MKLQFQYGYECKFKKSNAAFIIIQKCATSCYVISAFWLTLVRNGGKQNTKFL